MNSKERLLDAALKEFSEKGYEGATTKGIADLAGVNEVTLFRNFGNKEKLFRAVIDRDLDVSGPINELPTFVGKDPVEDITRLGLFISKHAKKRSRISKLIISDSTRAGIEEFSKRSPLDALPHLIELFEHLGAKDPEITAITFQSFIIRSVLFEAFLGVDPILKLDKKAIRRMAELLVYGMVKE